MQDNKLSLPEPGKVYRVAQWATGRIGASSLKELISSEQFDLVGVYVHSQEKEGIDAGELCGLSPTGVSATCDIDAIIALKPDCVVAVQEGCNLDDVCRFLEAGINIVTSRVDFLDPDQMDQDVRRRTEAACKQGKASIHATGSSPGFSSEVLPLVSVAMARNMEVLTIDEFADIPASCPDVQVVEGMGFGRKPGGEFDPGLLHHIAHGFRQSINTVADALDLRLDKIEAFGETANASERFLLPEGTPIEQGTVAAQRITVCGKRDGKALINFRLNWYCTLDINEDWELLGNGWQVAVQGGDTPIKINVSFPVAAEQLSPAMAALTAYRVINAIPATCAASAGIKRSTELPFLTPKMRYAG